MRSIVTTRDPAMAEHLVAKGFKLIGKVHSDGGIEFQFPDTPDVCAEVFTRSKQKRSFGENDSVVRTPEQLLSALVCN